MLGRNCTSSIDLRLLNQPLDLFGFLSLTFLFRHSLHLDSIPDTRCKSIRKSPHDFFTLHCKQTCSVPTASTKIWFFDRSRSLAFVAIFNKWLHSLHLCWSPSLLAAYLAKLLAGSVFSHPLHSFSVTASWDSRSCWCFSFTSWSMCVLQGLHLAARPDGFAFSKEYQAGGRSSPQRIQLLNGPPVGIMLSLRNDSGCTVRVGRGAGGSGAEESIIVSHDLVYAVHVVFPITGWRTKRQSGG